MSLGPGKDLTYRSTADFTSKVCLVRKNEKSAGNISSIGGPNETEASVEEKQTHRSKPVRE